MLMMDHIPSGLPHPTRDLLRFVERSARDGEEVHPSAIVLRPIHVLRLGWMGMTVRRDLEKCKNNESMFPQKEMLHFGANSSHNHNKQTGTMSKSQHSRLTNFSWADDLSRRRVECLVESCCLSRQPPNLSTQCCTLYTCGRLQKSSQKQRSAEENEADLTVQEIAKQVFYPWKLNNPTSQLR